MVKGTLREHRGAHPRRANPSGRQAGTDVSPSHRLRPEAAGPFAKQGEGSASGNGGLPLHGGLLIAGLAAAAANQGAYYPAGQWPVALLLLMTVLVALRARPWSREDTRWPVLWASIALGAWAVIRAALAHDVAAALPTLVLLAGVVSVAIVARRTNEADGLANAVVSIGALVALTGWAGVAWRASPWALQDQGLWRGATSLTYANAAAALLAMLAVLALGRLVSRPAWPLGAATVCLLLVGVGATLSRGGLLAAAAGVLVLTALLGVRPVARAALAPVTGAAIALAGLVPSMPATSPARPALAVLALAGGLVVAAGLPWVSVNPHRRQALLPALAVVVIVGVVAGPQIWRAIETVADSRLTTSSPDRARTSDAALRLVADHPVAGVGPGNATLSWVGDDGRTYLAKYAHNEYLQVLVELGIAGLGLVLLAFATVARDLRRGPATRSFRHRWAGGTAALAALGVGSAFDFLWHVPAIPLFGALLIGITVSNSDRKEQQ